MQWQHLEDQKKLETEVITTRRQIDAMHLQLREIQAEQERRKLDAEKCVTGAETAVLEWIHQQFASLRSTLTIQQSIGGTGLAYRKTNLHIKLSFPRNSSSLKLLKLCSHKEL
jgi:hypothetical protein